jgi:hypothetical protein
LGKWWGRKPLILVRASILGMRMPSSSNPKKEILSQASGHPAEVGATSTFP